MKILWLFLFTIIYHTESKEVCSLSFNYGLTSLFIDKYSTLQVAQDELELCNLCGQITRLGFLYANLPQTRLEWAASLKNNACKYIQKTRLTDCEKLTDSLIDAKEDFFLSLDARFSSNDMELSRIELSHLLEQKSYLLCSSVRCCTKKKSKINEEDASALEPLPAPETSSDSVGGIETRNELRNLNNQRLTLQQEKDALDQMRILFESTKRKSDDAQDKREQGLDEREDTLAKEKEVLLKQNAQNQTINLKKETDLKEWEKELEKLEIELEKDEQKYKDAIAIIPLTTTNNNQKKEESKVSTSAPIIVTPSPLSPK